MLRILYYLYSSHIWSYSKPPLCCLLFFHSSPVLLCFSYTGLVFPNPQILFYSLVYPQCLEQCLAGTMSYLLVGAQYIKVLVELVNDFPQNTKLGFCIHEGCFPVVGSLSSFRSQSFEIICSVKSSLVEVAYQPLCYHPVLFSSVHLS